jgi:hypothetical protein
VTIDRVWVSNWIYCTILQLVNYTSQITVGHTRYSESATVFTSHCFVVASNSRCSPSSGFPNGPQHQLPASHSNSSQLLNCSSPLTNSPTNNSQTRLLTCPAYNISAWTARKTLYLCCNAIVAFRSVRVST